MKKKTWRKISLLLLSLSLVLFGISSTERTGAWFVDSGAWVEVSYGVGVIEYTVYIDDKNIEKFKGGQKVSLMVPIIGAGKINDNPINVGAVTVKGETRGAHDEFDEAVTLVRTKIVNTGGLPAQMEIDMDTSNLTGSGILCMPIPSGMVASEKDYAVSSSGGGIRTYKEFIKSELGHSGIATPIATWNTYENLMKEVRTYWNSPAADGSGRLNRVLASQGKIPSVKKNEVTLQSPGFTSEILCWAEYDQMPYKDPEKAVNNSPAQSIMAKQGTLVLNIICTL